MSTLWDHVLGAEGSDLRGEAPRKRLNIGFACRRKRVVYVTSAGRRVEPGFVPDHGKRQARCTAANHVVEVHRSNYYFGSRAVSTVPEIAKSTRVTGMTSENLLSRLHPSSVVSEVRPRASKRTLAQNLTYSSNNTSCGHPWLGRDLDLSLCGCEASSEAERERRLAQDLVE